MVTIAQSSLELWNILCLITITCTLDAAIRKRLLLTLLYGKRNGNLAFLIL